MSKKGKISPFNSVTKLGICCVGSEELQKHPRNCTVPLADRLEGQGSEQWFSRALSVVGWVRIRIVRFKYYTRLPYELKWISGLVSEYRSKELLSVECRFYTWLHLKNSLPEQLISGGYSAIKRCSG